MPRRRKTFPIHMSPEPKRQVPNLEEVLGRNLAAAYIAAQHGIGMDYARKKYAIEPVDEFWMSAASMVIEHFQQHPALPPRTPPTVQ